MQKSLDYEIWQRFKKGDEEAFSYLFDVYHSSLFEYGQRFTSDEDLVKDSIQDLYFELARKREKLSATDNILFYLLRSLRQKILFNLRRQKHPTTPLRKDDIDEFRLSYSTEVDATEKELRLDQIAASINQLPARQKETIYLKFYRNLSNKEIAEIMQINYQSVGNNIQKAISRLKNLLDTDPDSIILLLQACLR